MESFAISAHRKFGKIILKQMNSDQKTNEFYERLEIELERSASWPSVYLFKFIVPTTIENVMQVENSFNNMGAIIKTTQSKTGKFTSISIDVLMQTANQVINKYKEVATINGIISL
jgi:putative lipoic acid-binding regulatory protein